MDTHTLRNAQMVGELSAMAELGRVLNELARGHGKYYTRDRAQWLLRKAMRLSRVAACYQMSRSDDRLFWRQRFSRTRPNFGTTKLGIQLSQEFRLWGPTGDLP